MNVWEESREESFGRDGAVVVRTFRVEPYTQRLLFIESLLGGIELVGGFLIRILPARDPWMPWLWCQEAKLSHIDDLNSPGSEAGLSMLATANYAESARVVATYKTLAPETAAGLDQGRQAQGNENTEKDLASFAFDFSAQQLTLPNQYWKWKNTDVLLAQSNAGITKTIPRVEFVMVRHFCRNLPFTAITQLSGRVNKSAFLTRGFLWAPETIRLDGASSEQKVTNRGVPFLDITYKFAVMPVHDFTADDADSGAQILQYVGWNRLYRPETSQWERPVATANPLRRPYQLDEDAPGQTFGGRSVTGFNLLFHPAAV